MLKVGGCFEWPPFFLVEGWKIQSISAKFEGISLEKDGTWTLEVLAKWPIIYCGEKTEIQHLTQLEAILGICFQST